MNQARAILWAQWRTWRNVFPRGGGIRWSTLIGAIWYGFWTVAALSLARLTASEENLGAVKSFLPGGLLLMLLYWQVVPLMMAATGASLDLRKLLVYPIPPSQLFSIEVMLRITGAVEMLLLSCGLAIGVLLNPALSKIGLLAIVCFVLLNLFLATGVSGLVARLLAHKRIREIGFFLLILCAALPQLLMFRGLGGQERLRALISHDSWNGFPWSAVSRLVIDGAAISPLAVLLAWTLGALVTGYWQFRQTLSFDVEAARATDLRSESRKGILERIYRLPSVIFSDPIAALVEKEIRFLARSPRFRLVFLMGFTFGLVIWLPMSFRQGALTHSFLSANYLTVVSVYSLLLLSEVCFWNSFGFDRSAAQFYFLSPVPFYKVLIGKNISAVIFIFLEISAITLVCALLGMPLDVARLTEAFSVAAVISAFLLAAGNLLSIHQARGINPANSFRRGTAGGVQAMLFFIYPIAFLPAGLAYLARWALNSEAAFFGVLAFDAIVGIIVYRLALESAVEGANRLKESMIAALAAGDGPIAG